MNHEDVQAWAESTSLEDIEEAVTARATSMFALRESWIRRAMMTWVANFGDLDAEPSKSDLAVIHVLLAQDFTADLLKRTPAIVDLVERNLIHGATLGATEVTRQFPELSAAAYDTREALDSPQAKKARKDAAKFTDRAARDMRRLVRNASTFTDLNAAIDASVSKVQSNARGSGRWALQRGFNEASEAVITANGAQKMWVAERNACLSCLAYSGEVTGGTFPEGLTFGTKGMKAYAGTLPGPPLHPNCRCRLAPWKDEWRTPGLRHDAPEALEREAMRSVLKGYSDFASNPERLRAAEMLLDDDPDLPKSVKTVAKNSVKRGSFPNPPATVRT